MLLCLHNRSSRAKLLTTEEADEAFNVTENKTNSITDVFFLTFYLGLDYYVCLSGDVFLTISKKNFSKPTERFVLEEMTVRLGSKAMPVLKELVE